MVSRVKILGVMMGKMPAQYIRQNLLMTESNNLGKQGRRALIHALHHVLTKMSRSTVKRLAVVARCVMATTQ
jgi:hypothetical protein